MLTAGLRKVSSERLSSQQDELATLLPVLAQPEGSAPQVGLSVTIAEKRRFPKARSGDTYQPR